MSKYVSIITVTYINSSEAIASQALAENMMEKIALDNGCDRVRCYLSGEVTRLIVFESIGSMTCSILSLYFFAK